MKLIVTKLETRQTKQKQSRIYVWPAGETIIQNLVNRRIRPFDEYRKVVIEELKKRNVQVSDIRLRWSKHAGCRMCPCSPGFIVDGYDPFLHGKDLHIVVEGDDSGATLDEAVAILSPSPE